MSLHAPGLCLVLWVRANLTGGVWLRALPPDSLSGRKPARLSIPATPKARCPLRSSFDYWPLLRPNDGGSFTHTLQCWVNWFWWPVLNSGICLCTASSWQAASSIQSMRASACAFTKTEADWPTGPTGYGASGLDSFSRLLFWSLNSIRIFLNTQSFLSSAR